MSSSYNTSPNPGILECAVLKGPHRVKLPPEDGSGIGARPAPGPTVHLGMIFGAESFRLAGVRVKTSPQQDVAEKALCEEELQAEVLGEAGRGHQWQPAHLPISRVSCASLSICLI